MRLNDYIRIDEFAEATAVTRLQESLHCVLFAVGQKKKKLTEEVWEMPDLLERAYNSKCSVDAPFGELYTFAQSKPDWAASILKATNLFVKSEWLKGTYTFHRNDAYMNSIYAQFQKVAAAEGLKLANDKWNPGDIWAAKGKMNIPSFDTVSQYNRFIYDAMKNSKLIGISLKKIAKSSQGKIVPQGPDQISEPMKFGKIKAPVKTMFPTGVNCLTKKPGHGINFRSPRPSVAAKVAGEIIIKGTGARHGKVPAKRLKEMYDQYKIPQMSISKIKSTSDGELQLAVIELWADCGYVFDEKRMKKDWAERKNDMEHREGYWQSIINSLEIAAFLNQSSVANKIMDYWWQGAKSASAESSSFVKIY